MNVPTISPSIDSMGTMRAWYASPPRLEREARGSLVSFLSANHPRNASIDSVSVEPTRFCSAPSTGTENHFTSCESFYVLSQFIVDLVSTGHGTRALRPDVDGHGYGVKNLSRSAQTPPRELPLEGGDQRKVRKNPHPPVGRIRLANTMPSESVTIMKSLPTCWTISNAESSTVAMSVSATTALNIGLSATAELTNSSFSSRSTSRLS